MATLNLRDVAVVVDPQRDHVAVARRNLPAGAAILAEGQEPIILAAPVQMGHRFAVRPVPAGQWVRQYGQPFGKSRGLNIGDPVNARTLQDEVPGADPATLDIRPAALDPWNEPRPMFQGFVRTDGRIGVRNWVLIVPTSMCSSHEASAIAARAEQGGGFDASRYPNVSGVTAIPHTRGCGCPDYEPGAGDDLLGVVEGSMRMLGQYIAHPNVGAVMVIELGCEKTNLAAVGRYVSIGAPAGAAPAAHPLEHFGTRHGKPVVTLSIQSCGGAQATIQRGLQLLPALLEQANLAAREPCDASALALGLKCGGSDAFSGLTANPALGVASDLLLRLGGRSVITEMPEFFGAEALFAARAVDAGVAARIQAAFDRFRRYVGRVGGSLADNPSPGNREGGLLNITLKSLGALAKSGAAPVRDVIDYGRPLPDSPASGLYLLYCPSYDQESTPALVGAGCQIVAFTTGRGTGIGNAIAPVIKIASNTPLAQRMAGDIDFNAGVVLDENAPVDQVGRQLFDLVLRVASGQSVKAEISGHREFMIWSEEGVSL